MKIGKTVLYLLRSLADIGCCCFLFYCYHTNKLFQLLQREEELGYLEVDHLLYLCMNNGSVEVLDHTYSCILTPAQVES